MPKNVNKLRTRHDIVICGLQCLPQIKPYILMPWVKCITFDMSSEFSILRNT